MTCCPRRYDGTSCSFSGRHHPRVQHQEEAPVAWAAAAVLKAAAVAAGDDGDGDDVVVGGDVGAHYFLRDTENQCRAKAVSGPHTPQSLPLTSQGYW